MGRTKGTMNLPKESEPLAPVICLACKRLQKFTLNKAAMCYDCQEMEKDPLTASINDQEGVLIKDDRKRG